jgi:hypothetical protein
MNSVHRLLKKSGLSLYLNARQISKYQTIGYSDVHLMLKNTCKEFADKELMPIAYKLDKMHFFPKDHVKKLGDLGLMGMNGWNMTCHMECASSQYQKNLILSA